MRRSYSPKKRKPLTKNYAYNSSSGGRAPVRKQAIHPSLKSALIIFIPLTLIQILNAFVFNIKFIYLYPAILVLYLISGILAGKFFSDSLHHTKPKNLRDSFVKHGAIAGLTLGIISLIFTIIFILLMDLTSMGIYWFGTATVAICAPIDAIVAMFIGALGAKIFEGVWR